MNAFCPATAAYSSINMDEALKLDSESILMANGMHFPLRQRNRLELINRFTEYQLKRMIRR